MLANVAIAVTMSFGDGEWNFWSAKSAYAACLQWRVWHGNRGIDMPSIPQWGADRQGLVKYHNVIGHYVLPGLTEGGEAPCNLLTFQARITSFIVTVALSQL